MKRRLVVAVKAAVLEVVGERADVSEGSNRVAVEIGGERFVIVVQQTQPSRIAQARDPARTDFR